MPLNLVSPFAITMTFVPSATASSSRSDDDAMPVRITKPGKDTTGYEIIRSAVVFGDGQQIALEIHRL